MVLPALEIYSTGPADRFDDVRRIPGPTRPRSSAGNGSGGGEPMTIPQHPDTARTAIEIHGLTKSFGSVRALDGLDMTVREGEVHGFLGPNGAGKSTTIRVLLGLVRADGGVVRLLGGDPWRDAVDPAPADRLRTRRCHPVAVADRRRDHRPAGPDARRHRRQATRRADRALRPRPAQEGARLLEGQPAEGVAGLGVLVRTPGCCCSTNRAPAWTR